MKEKKMIRVEYKHIEYEDSWTVPAQVKEMKAWCKEKFGKNPCGKGSTKIWAYNSLYCYNEDFDSEAWYGYYYPAFYFADEKQMAWFRLRWG